MRRRVIAQESGRAAWRGVADADGREREECVVECATYMTLARAGLDVEGVSVPYIAGWASEDSELVERDAQALEGARRKEEARVA